MQRFDFFDFRLVSAFGFCDVSCIHTGIVFTGEEFLSNTILERGLFGWIAGFLLVSFGGFGFYVMWCYLCVLI